MAPAEPSIRQRPPAVLTALRIYCLLLLGLFLLTPLLNEETAWGLWPVTYLSPVWRWLLQSRHTACWLQHLSRR